MSKSSPRGRSLSPAQVVSMLLVFVLLSTAGGILAAGFAMPAVGAAAAFTSASANFFDELPDDFDLLEPSQISVIKASDGTQIAQFYAENRIVVPLADISTNVQNAIIAVEDQRFYQHKGVDPTGIARAMVSNANGGSQGASTLTQQYVRNVLVEAAIQNDDPSAQSAATARSAGRKIREIKYALTLEQKYPDAKQRILEGYLNIAAFGPSTYGVEASARHYFSHSAKELSIPEAALLAGLTNAPGAYDPIAYPDKAKDRMDWVLDKMLEEQFIDQDQWQAGKNTKIEDLLHVTETVGGCGTAGTAAYFCEYVKSEIENSELFGATPKERSQRLLRGGLTITTTLDMNKQAAADAAVQEYVPTGDPSNVKAALSSVEPGTGRIVALSQNTNYGVATEDDPSTTQISLNADASHGGLENYDGTSGFQPGSTFKAFVLAEWYQEGHSGNDVFNTSPTTFGASDWTISCDPSKADKWTVGNANASEGGNHTVIQSTAQSINVGFARMTQQMDICNITDRAARLGVTTNSGNPLVPTPSIALGSQEVTPLQMASAYAAFAAHGLYCRPIAIDSILDADGNSLEVPSANCTQAMDSNAADKTAMTLTHVLDKNGTGKDAVLNGRQAAGKTGTTESMDNAWFTGFTPQLATSVWLGHSEGYSSMDHQYIGGRYYTTMYGSDAPVPLWKMYMDKALEGQPALGFTQVGLGVTPSAAPPSATGPEGQSGQDVQASSPAAGQSPVQSPAPSQQASSQGQPAQGQAPQAGASHPPSAGPGAQEGAGQSATQDSQDIPMTPPSQRSPQGKDGD
ncbi:transglycosylase domain-containing protein [Actinomyces israelii]|uniref:transglycosylase domain-containing protein n=1 Tax=Actinomyces israelii TaxID=1659 RepID=UPI002357E781|nr:transglycosylase domain-containing protein [Actinomyces israelii]WKR20446.1 Biosynthetic peptidoglycan transglycosylase [Actinomyces israelii]